MPMMMWPGLLPGVRSRPGCRNESPARLLSFYGTQAPLLRADDAILVLGCGTSRLSEALAEDGFPHITSVDISPTVIAKKRAKDTAGLSWVVGDMLALPFGDAAFDVVLDKGTLDVLFTDVKSFWCVVRRLFGGPPPLMPLPDGGAPLRLCRRIRILLHFRRGNFISALPPPHSDYFPGSPPLTFHGILSRPYRNSSRFSGGVYSHSLPQPGLLPAILGSPPATHIHMKRLQNTCPAHPLSVPPFLCPNL